MTLGTVSMRKVARISIFHPIQSGILRIPESNCLRELITFYEKTNFIKFLEKGRTLVRHQVPCGITHSNIAKLGSLLIVHREKYTIIT